MIDRVLCALPFKDTAFGLTRANHPLSLQLSPLLYFTISALNLTDQIFVLIIVQCIQIHRVLLSVDWKNTSRNSDYRDLFCSSVFSPIVVVSFRSLFREFVYDESIYGFEELVGLSLVFLYLSLSLFFCLLLF